MDFLRWLYPGIGMKRWIFTALVGIIFISVGISLLSESFILSNIEHYMIRFAELTLAESSLISGIIMASLGIIMLVFSFSRLTRAYLKSLFPERMKDSVRPIHQQRLLKQGPKIVVVGGGTGLSVLLRGLKHYSSNITAIVAVGDDGGSSGRLREEFGILPVGDLRNCIVALADQEDLMEKLFNHRFHDCGELEGHSLGNLLLVAMSQIKGSVDTAISDINEVLYVRGKVIPATLEPLILEAKLDDGSVVRGESRISQTDKKINHLSIIPAEVEPVQEALNAILEADAVILGPGSLYTSIIPNLLVKGIVETIEQSKAAKIYVCNVMTQPGETKGYTAGEHLEALYQHTDQQLVDYIVVNNQEVLDQHLLDLYLEEGAEPVVVDRGFIEYLGVKPVLANILDESKLVRHDSNALSKVILQTILLDKRYRKKYGIVKQMINLNKIKD